jgi:hypothetical protein
VTTRTRRPGRAARWWWRLTLTVALAAALTASTPSWALTP